MNVRLDEAFFEQLCAQAHANPRKRSHFNLHQDLNEPVQRLCIGLVKGTYVCPHHHTQRNKWELLLVLRGSVALVIFDGNGVVVDKLTLHPGASLSGIEIKPDTWHTVFPLSDEAVIMEIKEGPYTPTQRNDFAPWAPAEGSSDFSQFLGWLAAAQPGDIYRPANAQVSPAASGCDTTS